MFKPKKSEIDIQSSYYADTARTYDQMHVYEKDAHYFALNFMLSARGKGYNISEGDGLAYSYSIFNDFNYIAQISSRVHILNTSNTTSSDLYKTADSIALMAIKNCDA